MGRGVPAHCLCCLHPHSGRDTRCRRLPRVGTVLVTAGSGCQAIPVSGSLPSRHVPGRGPGLRDSDASGHKPKAGEPAPLSPSACRGWTPRTPPCCLGVGAGRGACAPLHPAAECPPSQLPSPRVLCLRCLSIPSPLLAGLALESGSWLCCPASPSLPVPLSPVPVPFLSPSSVGSRGAGRRLPRDEGVPSGPKPGCARQG